MESWEREAAENEKAIAFMTSLREALDDAGAVMISTQVIREMQGEIESLVAQRDALEVERDEARELAIELAVSMGELTRQRDILHALLKDIVIGRHCETKADATIR